MWLRVFERVNEAEVIRNFLRCGCLHENVGVIPGGQRGESVGRFIQGIRGDDGAG